jgi:hypothetical protein
VFPRRSHASATKEGVHCSEEEELLALRKPIDCLKPAQETAVDAVLRWFLCAEDLVSRGLQDTGQPDDQSAMEAEIASLVLRDQRWMDSEFPGKLSLGHALSFPDVLEPSAEDLVVDGQGGLAVVSDTGLHGRKKYMTQSNGGLQITIDNQKRRASKCTAAKGLDRVLSPGRFRGVDGHKNNGPTPGVILEDPPTPARE